MVIETGLVGFVVALACTPVARHVAIRAGMVDHPNHRSSHDRPTPRGGGAGILLGILAAFVMGAQGADASLLSLLAGGAILGLVGLVDDARGLSAGTRLIAQVVVATWVVMLGAPGIDSIEIPGVAVLEFGPAARILAVIWLVGVTNAWNFMDGINGIAALQSFIGAAAFTLVALRAGDLTGSVLSVSIAAASLGFLPWNFPRASVFMGDAGSLVLGFLLAGIALRLLGLGVPTMVVVLPLAPFLFDTAFTLARRLARRERVTTPHRTHFYQRLVISGWSHPAVTGLWAVLALVCSALGLAYEGLGTQGRLVGLVFVGALFILLGWWISRRSPLSAGNAIPSQNGS